MTLLKIPWFAFVLLAFASPLHAQSPTPEKQLIAAIEKIGGKVTLDKKIPGASSRSTTERANSPTPVWRCFRSCRMSPN